MKCNSPVDCCSRASCERLLDEASPFWRAKFFRKVHMVDIAQLVSASDCGSEGRGFESHYPPQKEKVLRSRGGLFFIEWMGFE